MDLFQTIGGADGCLKFSTAFYGRVALDPVLAPLFPGSLRCAIEAFTAFLIQLLGGPSEYSKMRWTVSLREAHLRFKIGEKERYAWLRNMAAALDDMGVEEPVRSALYRFFEDASVRMVNQPQGAVHLQLAQRGVVESNLEEIIAAIRKGGAKQALALTESPLMQAYFETDRNALSGVLGAMCGSSEAAILHYVRQKLSSDPALATERHARGRTLLHDAAAQGCLPIVELLLQLDADSNATDEGGHAPLYHVGNACSVPGGPGVVRVLAGAGADPDAADGVKHCTALHMAARRGNVAVAEALLNCGANLEARDTSGDTPLQRAVNCSKPDMVAFLLSRGAKVAYIRNSSRNARIRALLAGRSA